MIIANDKYNMTEINSSYYSVQMRLTVRNFRKSDFGGYKCISKNSIGDAEGNIRLYGKFFHFDIFLTYLLTLVEYVATFDPTVKSLLRDTGITRDTLMCVCVNCHRVIRFPLVISVLR